MKIRAPKARARKGSYVKVDCRDGTIFTRPVTLAEEKQELRHHVETMDRMNGKSRSHSVG